MKILYFADMHSIHSKRWIKYFADKNHEVHVIYPEYYSEGMDLSGLENLHFHKLESDTPDLTINFIFQILKSRYKIKNLIKAIIPDIIHVHFVDFWAYLILSLKFHPFIVTAWGSDILILPKQNIANRIIASTVLKRADMITCDAEHMKNTIQNLGIPADKIRVIHFGTDLTKFNPEKKDEDIRKELGFEENVKLVISLRALNPIYNIATFIKAIPLILERREAARFVVVGDGSEKESLMQLSVDLGIQDKVRFTGRLSDDDLQRYTASADIYVSTSLSDGGLAASTAEAMACGVSVVITDFGDNSEWVVNNRSGLLFRLEDFRELADKIVYLMDNPEDATAMAIKGRMIIDERNNWHKEMEKVEQMYCELIQ